MALWRRWFLATTAGEVAGFCAPAIVGALAFDLPLPQETAVLVAAGLIEGTALGFAQGTVVRRARPAISTRQWTVATAAGAGIAWLSAMSGVMLMDTDLPLPVVVPATAALGVALLLSIGTTQWWVLRGQVPRAGRWIVATAVAWIVALLAFVAVTTPLWQAGQPVVLIAAIGVLGGLIMAATMAAVSGWAFVRLVGPWSPAAVASGRSAADAGPSALRHLPAGR